MQLPIATRIMDIHNLYTPLDLKLKLSAAIAVKMFLPDAIIKNAPDK